MGRWEKVPIRHCLLSELCDLAEERPGEGSAMHPAGRGLQPVWQSPALRKPFDGTLLGPGFASSLTGPFGRYLNLDQLSLGGITVHSDYFHPGHGGTNQSTKDIPEVPAGLAPVQIEG